MEFTVKWITICYSSISRIFHYFSLEIVLYIIYTMRLTPKWLNNIHDALSSKQQNTQNQSNENFIVYIAEGFNSSTNEIVTCIDDISKSL